MAGSSNNIVISPVNVYWRIEHQSVIDHSGLVDPDGTSYDVPDSTGAIARIWFDLDAGSTPPATPSGGRLIEVDVTTGDASTVIAAAVQAAVDLDGAFNASVDGNLVTIDGAAVGRQRS